MQMAFLVKPLFNGVHFLNTIHGINSCNSFSLNLPSKSGVFVSFPLVSRRIRTENFVVCARRKNRRSGSQRTTKFLLKSLSLLLGSNLQILPQPLDLIVAELGCGDGGGGLGFRRGFGGWGGFDGWRRKGKRMALWLSVQIILGFCGFCIISGKVIIKRDMILPILGFSFVASLALINELKIKAKDLVFVFCCFGALLFVGSEKENFVKLGEEIRVFSAGFLHSRSKRSKRSHRRSRM